ncbi:hypothetical protein NDU88_010555 [Pleurodeles waltl]|uniref:Uncharacterized protein n=1 Tax=Pleurodeles waltl TaxID=8319 RepID=A0AAV7Q0H0_PLEWA|nr:hypothetical protein NDU88_010555 [Pleurodeles waltl]
MCPREGLLELRRGSDRGLEPLRPPRSWQSSGPYGTTEERWTGDDARYISPRCKVIGSEALPWALRAVSRPLVGQQRGQTAESRSRRGNRAEDGCLALAFWRAWGQSEWSL